MRGWGESGFLNVEEAEREESTEREMQKGREREGEIGEEGVVNENAREREKLRVILWIREGSAGCVVWKQGLVVYVLWRSGGRAQD